MKQLNIRLSDSFHQALREAAKEEGESLSEYCRQALAVAVHHSRCNLLHSVRLAPGEDLSEERAVELGLTPIDWDKELEDEWPRLVYVDLGKHGLFEDKEGGVWAVTPEGLKCVMSFGGDVL